MNFSESAQSKYPEVEEQSQGNISKALNKMAEGKFGYEASTTCASPSANYFWYRKRQEVIKICTRNLYDLLKSTDTSENPSLFVDIGCGDGTDLFLIHNLFVKHSSAWKFIGLEANTDLVQICKMKQEYYKASGVDFMFSNAISKLPFSDGEVNLVYCSEVIEHILEPEALFQEIKRVLKPGGYLLLTTPNQPNVFQRSYWINSRRQKMQETMQAMKVQPEKLHQPGGEEICIYGHISLKNNQEWDEILSKIGFQVVDNGRGALTYGGTYFYDNEFILGIHFLLQSLLDLLPRKLGRNFSDQLICLYKVKDS
ncbi:class I SAM-dependent methyltransferase [Roseofilum sp. BLCC_M154]|uniref:Class I SAM-dependent methyltransferase n=1 Tax=Roseofilum acuticapitatum BLCC-M154 TaxID=3022444 RepID=A0ABT7AML4_9CYAN|nr:class I SAM-dependent methyltransferase [Roseofilum acuticapitatum]MDJ1168131.1 class I SAM-dependent methyltransferase [Roseofilum acuticapitatum BLCC-M154]